MKFKFITKVEGEVMSLGNLVKTGDIVDLPPHLAAKAAKRPNDYRKVEEKVKTGNKDKSADQSEDKGADVGD